MENFIFFYFLFFIFFAVLKIKIFATITKIFKTLAQSHECIKEKPFPYNLTHFSPMFPFHTP